MKTSKTAILALSALLAISPSALGADYAVPGDYASIQDAVNAASSGDVITVGPGTWPGRLDFRGKDLTVRSSDGPESTTIDSNGVSSGVLFRTQEGPGAVLEGFTITGGTGSLHANESFTLGGGIAVVSSAPTIRNCILTKNSAHFGGGIGIWEGSPVIEDCLFIANHATGDGGGLRLHEFSYPIIRNSSFLQNTADVFGVGIAYGNDSDGQHIDCMFDGNTAGLRGGAIASACTCNDPNLSGSSFCNSLPDHILGGWQDNGGNDFCPVCAMDVDADGDVDTDDILQVISAWGGCICVEDVDGDTVVGVNDLLAVVAEFGDCPE
ncbi:MAG: hypothetical protein CMJ39_05730 [Phycisphaerae bacterium]|nr:hypothetical protein [Phycisphaerae bacterium]